MGSNTCSGHYRTGRMVIWCGRCLFFAAGCLRTWCSRKCVLASDGFRTGCVFYWMRQIGFRYRSGWARSCRLWTVSEVSRGWRGAVLCPWLTRVAWVACRMSHVACRMSHVACRMSHEPDPCPAAAQRRIVRNRSVKPGHPDQVFDQPDRLPQRKGASCFQDEAGPARSSRDPGPENGPGGVQIIQYEDRVREVAGVATLITQIISNGTPAVDILLLKQSKAFGISFYDAPKVIPTKSYYTETELRNCEAQRASALLRLDAQGRRLGNPFSAHRAHASRPRRLNDARFT